MKSLAIAAMFVSTSVNLARADESAAEVPDNQPPAVEKPDREITMRGYFLSRFQYVPTRHDAVLYPLLDVEKFQGFLEGNLDLTIKSERYTFRSDTSALYRVSPAGCRAGSDVPACLVINELYLTYDVIPDKVSVLVGRHRPSWGAALSLHPVEPMNPQPDPTDPSFQRLGAWTAMVEASAEHHVATVGWFPNVTNSIAGTPKGVSGGLVGGRYRWSPEHFDVSAIGFYDLDTQLPEAGTSGSMVVGESNFEIHGEALVHKRREIKTGTLQKGTCPVRSLGIPLREVWDYSGIFGTRWDGGGGTLVNFEYMHVGDGMVGSDFRAVLNTADLLSQMCPDGRLEANDVSQDGRPSQFSSTFLRRNYLILSGFKPSFGEDGRLAKLGASATILAGLDDTSGVATARLQYTLEDTTVVRLGGLATFGGARTQYGILPFHSIILVDVQTLF